MKKHLLILAILFLPIISPSLVSAAEFTLSPASGKVVRDTTFTTDIMIDTEGEEVALARAVVTYDPEKLKIIKAERNDSLFCSYPEDEQSVDNENGVVVLTGFCQSGGSVLYETQTDADVFGRLEFDILAETGTMTLDWEYSGEDEPFKSVIMKDGSPPQNILSEKPSSGTYALEAEYTPVTGVGVSYAAIILGALVMVVGYVLVKGNLFQSKKKTVVLYE